MADFGNVESMLAGLDPDQRRILNRVLEYILKDIRFGRAEAGDPSKNFGAGFFSATTPAVANEEFTITHTFGRPPYLLIPVLPLDQVGAKIVRVEVTQPADSARIYLRSPETEAPVFYYLEG